MIVDTSALVAILRAEPDGARLAAALQSQRSAMSAATYLEAGIVIDSRRDPVLSVELDDLIARTATQILPVSPSHARIARQAYRDFGKGSGHPAQLNFGDCFSYALVQDTGEALLYQGEDFTHAGVRSALPTRGA